MYESNNDKNISQVFEKSEYTWTLSEFSKIKNEYEEGYALRSPIFPEAERKYKWELKIFPNSKYKKDHLSIYVVPSTEICNNFTVHLAYTFRNISNDLIDRGEKILIIKNNTAMNYIVSFPHDKLMLSINDDDILQIHVIVLAEVLTLQPHHTFNAPKKKSHGKLSVNWGDMFKSDSFKDFTIKFQDKTEVTVHRNISAARSPVSAAMLDHDLSENTMGFTETVDIDKATMIQLLNFIFTGNVENLTEEEALKLLVAANEYQMADLTELCSEALKDKLAVSTALDILILAEIHNASDLKEAVFDYIVAKWEKFSNRKNLESLKKYPDLLVEFTSKILQSFMK